MNVSRLAVVSSVAFLLVSCKISVGPNPRHVPREQELISGAVPVTLVTLEASDAGYKFLGAKHFLGTPTPTILDELPVLITAHDEEGKLIGSVSVFNPREGHALGTRTPEQFTLPTRTVTVRFEDPDKKVRFVTVTVRSGPNSRQPPARIWLGTPPTGFNTIVQ